MKKSMTYWIMLLVTLFSLSVIVACGNTTGKEMDKEGDANKDNVEEKANNEENNTEEEPEEITIRWAHQWGEDHFDETIGDIVKEKFPHITFEVQEAGTDHPESLEDFIAAKKSPDVVSMGLVTHVMFLNNLGLAYDMDELVANSDFDLERLEPTILEYSRRQDPDNEGGLYVIPNARPTWSLHYNKDVFDALGEDYPEDGMTWEETANLAKKLTREVDGVQYRGLDLDVPNDAFLQFSESLIDPDTDDILVQESEGYKRYLEMIKDVVSIPGNYPAEEPESLLYNWGSLFPEGKIAMAPAATNWGWLDQDNVDIVTYPVWEGYEGINPEPNAGGWAITEPSEYKEEVLEVITYLLSDEVQIATSKTGGKGGAEGGTSVLKNTEVLDAFAEENENLDDKNIESLFKNAYATGPEKKAKYRVSVSSRPKDFIESGKDVNEYLRIFQELAEEKLREDKASE